MLKFDRGALVALFAVTATACATHTGPAALPSVPVRSWQVRSSDGGSAQVYFRNDATTPQTISTITLQRCVNTREPCGDYPVHLVIEPGKTMVGMKVQRLSPGRSWSFGSSYVIDRTGADDPVTPKSAARMLSPDEVKRIGVEEFVPAVKPMTTSGSCGDMQRGMLKPGSQALVMFFAPSKRSKAERMVSVIYDSNGHAVSYSDQRGDIFVKDPNQPDAPRAHPRTTISINLDALTGMLRNDGGGLPESIFLVQGPELLTAASLGRPQDLIIRVWKECAKPH